LRDVRDEHRGDEAETDCRSGSDLDPEVTLSYGDLDADQGSDGRIGAP
jgi:hypothetical protein